MQGRTSEKFYGWRLELSFIANFYLLKGAILLSLSKIAPYILNYDKMYISMQEAKNMEWQSKRTKKNSGTFTYAPEFFFIPP